MRTPLWDLLSNCIDIKSSSEAGMAKRSTARASPEIKKLKAANLAYYEALSARDIRAMARVWTCAGDNILIAPPENPHEHTQIRETIPDSFLKRADEVVNVDITVEELRSRLKQGKIYAPEKIEQSLANFFRKGNLSMLRELALRTTAEEVGSQAAEYRRSQGLEQAPIPEKVMVCLSPRPGAERLLRVGSRIAGRLATNWYAVRVESPMKIPGMGTRKSISAWKSISVLPGSWGHRWWS